MAYALLQRMLNFVQNLQYYMTFEVLEPNWRELEKSLRSVHTIDDVLSTHTDFLDKSLRDCLLSDRELLKIVSRLSSLCITFTDYLQRSHPDDLPAGSTLEVVKNETKAPHGSTILPSGEVFEGGADPRKLRNRLLSSEWEVLGEDSFEESISKLDEAFSRDFVNLLHKLFELGGNTVGSMVSRLDFNGFYQDKMRTNVL